MSEGFDAYFKSLAGSWSLERTISSGEKLNGKAVFEIISDTAFLMREEGELTLLSGASIRASRNWYWHLVDNKRLEITYNAERDQDYHLIALRYEEGLWRGQAEHLCGADLYEGYYQFCNNQFEIKQTVKGPAKDYRICSIYKFMT